MRVGLAPGAAHRREFAHSPHRLETPKVAVVMPHGRIAGAERVLLELLEELAPGGLVVCAPEGSPLDSEIRERGHRVAHFELTKLSASRSKHAYARDYLAAFSRLRWIVRQNEVDVLHSFVAFTSKVVAPVAVATRTPGLLSVHEITTAESIGSVRSAAQRMFTRMGFSRLTAVSHYVADSLVASGYKDEKIEVLHNGITRSTARIDRATSRGALGMLLPGDAVVFALVARMTRWKGQQVALEAFARLCESHPELDTRLVMVGGAFEPQDATFRKEIEHRVDHLGLAGRVTLHGDRRDVETFYDAADVVLVPSAEPDPFPTVVLEAGLSERPVVVTDRGGAREAVLNGTTGLVAQPTPSAFALAMEKALDPQWRVDAGCAARVHVEQRFSRRAFAERMVELWAQTARGASKRPFGWRSR